MKGIDNQDSADNQDIHTGIDNQGPVVQHQQQPIQGIPNQNPMGGPQINNDPILNQIQNQPINPNKNALVTSFGVCPECGLSHPPIPNGEPCPNASMEAKTSTAVVKITDQEFNKFLVQMKNILVSQLDQIKVTNSKEIFTHLTMKIMEALEELKKK